MEVIVRSMRQLRSFSTCKILAADYSHAVIGGGVVGLAIASELLKNRSNRVLLIEKNSKVGEETSSRNSEVIHAGLYYPVESLKMKLCIQGKELIYNEAAKNGVAVQNCGKWLVAQNDQQDSYLEKLYHRSLETHVPTEFVALSQAKYIEPAVIAKRSILSSPTSGILSAHDLMDYLQGKIQDCGGEMVMNSQVDLLSKSGLEYEVGVSDSVNGEQITISCENVVNSAGLNSDRISNLLLPQDRHVLYEYAKGNYFTLKRSHLPVRRLIYPAPMAGLKGLGTHLTISLDGQIKFGPDREIVDKIDYKPNPANIPAAAEEIAKYYPGVLASDLQASYSGIRPQLKGVEGFQDFIIREEPGFKGFVNLLNIDSPGLTCSMAIGKYVYGIYHGAGDS